jgi:hypothetical protein
MATQVVPGAAELLAVIVSTLVPPVEIETGLKDAVTPGGREGADRVAVPVKFPTGIIVTVAVADSPGNRVQGMGETFR